MWCLERATHQINYNCKIVKIYSYREGGIIVCAGICLSGHTDLRVSNGWTLIAARYWDEIFSQNVSPYAGIIDDNVILIDDESLPNRTRYVHEYIEDMLGVNGMTSSISVSFENYLSRQVVALNRATRSLQELEQAMCGHFVSFQCPKTKISI